MFILFGLALTVGLIWFVMAAPLGRRSVGASVLVDCAAERVWRALYPFGADAGWNGAIAHVRPLDGDARTGRIVTAHEGRDGKPIERDFALEHVVAPHGFRMRYTADSALDQSHWRNHRYEVAIAPLPGGRCRVTLCETDIYRGAAFFVFRFFALRRLAGKLKIWAETGRFAKGGVFERPSTQLAMAGVSALLLWPLFGLDAFGLFLSATLTAVVALHELGHMAAFRLMGHRSARMIFIPVLGGLALGGRPYDTRFEVGFAALMGAGFSAFLAATLMAAHSLLAAGLEPLHARALVVIALICALFNLGNLAPVWKFDGGQVIRQLFASRLGQGVAASTLLICLVATGIALGVPLHLMLVAGLVIAVLSVMTAGNGVRPKRPLTAMSGAERVAIAAGLAAVSLTHAAVLVWSVGLLFA